MNIFTFGFAVVIMAVSTGLPLSLRADEEKQAPLAVDEAGEKSNAENSKQRARLLKELRSGSPGPTHGRMCRPSGPEVLYFPSSGGSRHRQRMCRASSPDEMHNFKTISIGLMASSFR